MFLFKRNQNECGLTCEIKSVFFLCFRSNDGRRENKYVSLYHFCTLKTEVVYVCALRIFHYR